VKPSTNVHPAATPASWRWPRCSRWSRRRWTRRTARPPPAPLVAFIREDECIGCTKCIQACPVDAILGAAKHMHTVIASECTGCDLCVAPCPVDCIDMIAQAPTQ
jgi:RnfABCDGE-type electron transport complex B subunit